MEYKQPLSPPYRGLFVIAIDQSASMQHAFAHCSMIVSKSQVAAMLGSTIIDEIVVHSGKLRDICDTCPYCDIVVLGYSGSNAYPLLSDGVFVLPITHFEQHSPELISRTFEYLRTDDRLELVTENFHEWIAPQAIGSTPLIDSFTLVNQIVSDWCNNPLNCHSLPPIIFNITDGFDDTNNPEQAISQAEIIKSNRTNHGNTLLINVCIDSEPDTVRLTFPNADSIPADHPAETLANMASILPEWFHPVAKHYNPDATPPYRAICYNATALSIIPMLDIVDRI